MPTSSESLTFRPRARLLQLMGDQLIGSSRLAVFELVKNAYDADASNVRLTFHDLGTEAARIVIRDNGEGMSLDVITNVWLEPGADYRELQKQSNKRSPKFHRLPLGEKGVGRFAVHKLGTRIKVNTKQRGQPEYEVSIDWEEYAQHKYMDEAAIHIVQSKAPLFKHKESGTEIEISGLRTDWKQGDIRRLWRNVKSISSPTKAPESFNVELYVPRHESWLDGLLDTPDFLDRAMWHFTFLYENGKFEWAYKFTPLPGIGIKGRTENSLDSPLKLAPQDQKLFPILDEDGKEKRRIIADEEFTQVNVNGESKEAIGPILGEFYAFDRDRPVLQRMTEATSLTDFLDENGGVRVYRDGVRVYNYGEHAAGDDWLGLDQRRVNIPTRRLSNNILIGAIDLSLASSGDKTRGLLEKTNREGFVENEAFAKFKAIVLGALIEFEHLRDDDKNRIRIALKTVTEAAVGDIEDPINALRAEFDKRRLSSDLGKHLKAIEQKFGEMKEVMTHAGMAGLNLGILFHEIDRGVKGLTSDIRKKVPLPRLLERAEHLSQLLDGFSTLLRKDRKRKHQVKELLEECKFLNASRFDIHNVIFSCPILTGEQESFQVNAAFGMFLGALSNLIDNSIYWLQVKWPERKTDRKNRAIYIGATDYFDDGPALVIADNGPGLSANAADLVRPFMTTKPDGMGLGLYYVNLVCELNNARLVASPNRQDVGIPPAYDGAAFAIVFSNKG
ncbi:ATP-binding protein [Bradyrhizobium sp. ORS 86]|uniref:ATP-binding protein n=1 Tax=Bradyrhizobium sp. ORS 86 TaxID=1685970 RepID=UPI00388E8B37